MSNRKFFRAEYYVENLVAYSNVLSHLCAAHNINGQSDAVKQTDLAAMRSVLQNVREYVARIDLELGPEPELEDPVKDNTVDLNNNVMKDLLARSDGTIQNDNFDVTFGYDPNDDIISFDDNI